MTQPALTDLLHLTPLALGSVGNWALELRSGFTQASQRLDPAERGTDAYSARPRSLKAESPTAEPTRFLRVLRG